MSAPSCQAVTHGTWPCICPRRRDRLGSPAGDLEVILGSALARLNTQPIAPPIPWAVWRLIPGRPSCLDGRHL